MKLTVPLQSSTKSEVSPSLQSSFLAGNYMAYDLPRFPSLHTCMSRPDLQVFVGDIGRRQEGGSGGEGRRRVVGVEGCPEAER